MSEALKRTFTNREHNFTLRQFEKIFEFDSDKTMQKKWKSFIRKIDTVTDDFSAVLKTIKAFLTKPFTAALENKEFDGQWFADENKWKK